MKFNKKNISLVVVNLLLIITLQAQNLIHPGVSHTLSDLDRMKYMVEAVEEPWISTYNELSRQSQSGYNYSVRGNSSNTTITAHSDFIEDGFAAYQNALMWYITGDTRHAEKCVDIFNAWSNIRRIEDQFALNNGRGPWKMLEGAEIIKHTYSGWSSSEQSNFAEMLVYPGWSGTSAPTSAINSKDVSFYWNIYQGDRVRHGNQGLYAYRSLMAMGIFLDNEIMYERALRYLQGLPHRSDDLAYPSGPPNTSAVNTGCEYYNEFSINSHNNTEDYGYNEVLGNYIWESGQSQESSRDQAHGLGGVSAIASICEMAWSQGDDLYGHLDNRLLTGWEFYFRYNLSYVESFSDQSSPWEPTVESEEFIRRTDRSGRWESLKINPFLACNTPNNDFLERGKHLLEPIYEQSLAHYRDRLLLPSSETKWLQRSYEYMTENIGFEDGRHSVDHAGWGGLKFHRVNPGDPISGFDSNGLPVYAMNILPMTIEAENFDYFVTSGKDLTYSDTSNGNSENEYRIDENVDIEVRSGGGYNIKNIDAGEWLTYTVYVPETTTYDIAISYAASSSNGEIKFEFSGTNKTGEVNLPTTGGTQIWQDYTIEEGVLLSQGVQSMKVLFSGTSNSFNLNNIVISNSSGCVASSSFLTDNFLEGITYKYYEGTWDSIPDFEDETVVESGVITEIGLGNGERDDSFGYSFDGYVNILTEGEYTFYTNSDDGSNLYIDGVKIVDNDGKHGTVEISGDICLQTGYHQIKVEYFENSGTNDVLEVEFEGPGVSKTAITNLYHLDEDILDIDSFDPFSLSIKIYPNPVSSIATIENALGLNFHIHDMNGSIVFTKLILSDNEIIDLSVLSTGVYYAGINNQRTLSVVKIVKD